MATDDLLTLTIETLSSNGEGIARHEGQVHFVPRALPGETCRVRVVHETKNWRRALVVERTDDSPDRVAPLCPLYDACGGCQLQHLRYEQQCAFKRSAVAEALRRIGHFEIEPEPTVASRPFGYRRKVTFAAVRDEGRVRLCLHCWDNPEEVVPVPSCPQLEPELDALLPRVEQWLNAPALRKLRAALRRVMLRRWRGETIAALLLDAEKPVRLPSSGVELPEGLAAAYAGPDRTAARLQPLASVGEVPRFPGAFCQANAGIEEALYAAVVERVPAGCKRAVDAYAGAGDLSVRLARAAQRVTAIETGREAVSAARLLLAEAGLAERVRVRRGPAERLLRGALPADFVVLDPPRAGCHADVLDALVQRPPARLAYISCHPAALARDLRVLVDGGFRLARVVPFDMFPQTHHVEVLALLES